VGREGLADRSATPRVRDRVRCVRGACTPGAGPSSVAQDPFRGLTGWRARRPRLPHLWSLPRSRLELHAPSITTVQDPRRPFAYSEERHAGARDPLAKTAQHELSTGHCEIRQVQRADDPPGRHVAQHRSGGPAMTCGVGGGVPGQWPRRISRFVELPASSPHNTRCRGLGIRAAQIARRWR